MQKKIIALALASALTAPALAMADVTVYGKADLALGTSTNGTVRTQQISSQVTKLGFKGSEDLGDGLNAIWQIEQQIDINNANGTNATHQTFAGRNSFLGLKGESWGTLMLGRHDTPYKIATRGLDVFGDQFADNRHLMGGNTYAPLAPTTGTAVANNVGGSYMDMRPGNEMIYISPSFSGFKVAASYAFGAENASVSTTVKGNLLSIAGMYDQGPLKAAIAYQKIKYGSTGSLAGAAAPTAASPFAANDSFKAWKLGVGYTVIEGLEINAVYEKLTSSIAAPGVIFAGVTDPNALGRTDWYLAGKYSFGNDDVKIAYTKAGNYSFAPSSGARMIGIGYDHNLSKRTSLYVQYAKISNDSFAAYGFNGAATTLNSSGVVTGSSPSGLVLGMKHTF